MRKSIAIVLLLALLLTLALPAAAVGPGYYGMSHSRGQEAFPVYLVAVVAALALAGICTFVVWSGMNNVKHQDRAAHYTAKGGLKVTGRYEHFLRRTRTRHRIQTNNRK